MSLMLLLCNNDHHLWKSSGIKFMYRDRGMINFDIVIPTACGAIFACQIVCDAEVSVAFTYFQ